MKNLTKNQKVRLILSSFMTIVSILILTCLIASIVVHPNSSNGTTGAIISLMALSLIPLFLGIYEIVETKKELKNRKL